MFATKCQRPLQKEGCPSLLLLRVTPTLTQTEAIEKIVPNREYVEHARKQRLRCVSFRGALRSSAYPLLATFFKTT